MDEFQTMWKETEPIELNVINFHKVETIYSNLRAEEERKNKYMPWTYAVIMAVMAAMAFMVKYTSGNAISAVQCLGLMLIAIGGVTMAYLLQLYRIPVHEFEHDQSSRAFMEIVRTNLNKRKILAPLAVAIYIVLLTGGLHLLIFGFGSLVGQGGSLGILYGMMAGLTGMSIAMMITTHNMMYGKMLKKINTFLNMENELI